MTLPGGRINKFEKGRGWGVGRHPASHWSTNTGCENPGTPRQEASLAAERFLISEPAAFNVKFSVCLQYEDIITGQSWELSHRGSLCSETGPSTIHCPSFKRQQGSMIKDQHPLILRGNFSPGKTWNALPPLQSKRGKMHIKALKLLCIFFSLCLLVPWFSWLSFILSLLSCSNLGIRTQKKEQLAWCCFQDSAESQSLHLFPSLSSIPSLSFLLRFKSPRHKPERHSSLP